MDVWNNFRPIQMRMTDLQLRIVDDRPQKRRCYSDRFICAAPTYSRVADKERQVLKAVQSSIYYLCFIRFRKSTKNQKSFFLLHFFLLYNNKDLMV